ncbi:hypothetical protein [Peredibacter starrii]|uniref:C-type lysozyme inhibitor domain-containing protein n=1 Tax=Peredibacter starrii TaxID=28202 RepID=A0AAX4HUU0_9BACT|nr:hypothetical protein [Peredibacter starrii]WPU67001.1 hypothetical protein SOO65_09580 [Peredibacter starrii]
MRTFILFIFCLMPSLVFARDCEVYGISDSPQALTCSFKRTEVKLRCKDGTYYLNQSKVDMAFHMEVEDGPVPLVFKSSNMQLTVLMHSKTNIEAELEQKGKVILGSCN